MKQILIRLFYSARVRGEEPVPQRVGPLFSAGLSIVIVLGLLLFSGNAIAVEVGECGGFAIKYAAVSPCAGNDNGKISLGSRSGAWPLSYSIDNGASFQSTGVFEKLGAGKYRGVIKDAGGCLSEFVDIQLTETAGPVVALNLPSTTFCVSGTPSELTGGNPAGGFYTGPGVDENVFSPEVAGVGTHMISYTYTDGSGCGGTVSQEVVINATPNANAGNDVSVYPGQGPHGCTTLTASTSEGTAPYTYLWSTGETSTSINVCPTDTTAYTLTVTDALGCSGIDEVYVFTTSHGGGNGDGNGGGNGHGHGYGHGNGNGNGHAYGHDKGKGAHAKTITEGENITESDVIVADVMIFPNPVRDNTQLKVVFKDADMATMDIIESSGRVVTQLYKGDIAANQAFSFDIDRSLGNQTFYIFRIITSKDVHTFKLIMQ